MVNLIIYSFSPISRLSRLIPAMIRIAPAAVDKDGISLKNTKPRTDANTGSSSFTADTKDAFSYFRPQENMLWPRRVQKTARPRAIQRLWSRIATTGFPPAKEAIRTTSPAKKYTIQV